MKSTIRLIVLCFMASFSTQAQDLAFGWAKQVSGTGSVQVISIATDDSGNVYYAGHLVGSADFDPGPKVFDLTSNGSQDAFLAKMDASGNFCWAFQLGNAGNETIHAMAVNSFGNVTVVGRFNGALDADPSTDSFMLSSPTSWSTFICQYSSSGKLISAKKYFSDNPVNVYAVEMVDGNIYFAGQFFGTFTINNKLQLVSSSSSNSIFMLKIQASDTVEWAVAITGKSSKYFTDIKLDGQGNVYCIGSFSDSIDFDPGPSICTLKSSIRNTYDVFITKLSSNGQFVWARQLGGKSTDNASELSVDSVGNICIIGEYTDSVDLDPESGNAYFYRTGGYYYAIVRLDKDGKYCWAAQFPAGNPIQISSKMLLMDNQDNIYMSSSFFGTANFDFGTGTKVLKSNNSSSDMFLAKYNSTSGDLTWIKQLGGKSSEGVKTFYLTKDNQFILAGWFNDTVDFDPGSNTFNMLADNPNSTFILKLDPAFNTGIQNPATNSGIRIYPNPSNGIVHVSSVTPFHNAALKVFDMQGKLLLSESNLSGNTHAVSLQQFPNGIYMLEVLDGNLRSHFKVIKAD